MSDIKNHVLKSKNEKITSYFTADHAVTIDYRTIYGHNGIDIVPEDDVITPEDGTVIYVKADVRRKEASGSNDFGNNVKIKVNNKYILRFCHLAYGTIDLRVGDKVKVGDIIGRMGSTGFSTSVHLHFGLYDISSGTEVAINPLPYLEGNVNLTDIEINSPITAIKFKVGDRVRINVGAKDYDGNCLEPFLYSHIYNVKSVNSNDSVTLMQKDKIKAAVSAEYLTLVSTIYDFSNKEESPINLKVGDKVKIKWGRTACDGSALATFNYENTYSVSSIGHDKDRICIGNQENMYIAVWRDDLIKII